MYDITSQQIEAFLAVARCLNMSRAAKSLFISQPTLSKTLKRFENRIGFTLFSRSNRGMSLTPQGEFLYKTLRQAYNSMELAIDNAKAISESSKKVLRVGLPSMIDFSSDFQELNRILDRFQEKHPEILLTKQLCDFYMMPQLFYYGSIDVMLAPEFVLQPEGDIRSCKICSCSENLAIRADLMRGKGLEAIRQIRDLTVYAFTFENVEAARERVLLICRANNIPIKHIELVNTVPELLHALLHENGIVIGPSFSGGGFSGEVWYSPLKPHAGEPYFAAFWHDEPLSGPAIEMITLLTEEFGSELQPVDKELKREA